MVIYKPYQTSAFIIAMFDHYKASNPCNDVACSLTVDIGPKKSGRMEENQINQMIHLCGTPMNYLYLSYISVFGQTCHCKPS